MFRIPPPYLWTPLSPQRVKGCSPLTSPKKKSKPKNASRFAKRIFLCFSHLRLRRRFQALAELYRQQRGNTSCGAANRRSEKNAFSEAASIFPLRLPLRGLKGASSPFLVDPARRNRWWFSGSLLTSKENISLNEKALCPAHRRENQLKEKNSPALWPARSASHLTERKNLPHAAGAPARSASLYLFAIAISARFSSRIRSSTVFTAVSTSALGMRAMSTAHA